MPAVVADGTVKLTEAEKLPLPSVLTLVGDVVTATPSNLNPDTVEPAANPCPCTVTVTPGLAGSPAEEFAGVNTSTGLTVKLAPVAVSVWFCSSIATNERMPAGTFGTVQLPFGWVPAMVPSELAVSTHTTSVSKVLEPIWTKIASPAVQPWPDTVKPRPGAPEIGDTTTVRVVVGPACLSPSARAGPALLVAVRAADIGAGVARASTTASNDPTMTKNAAVENDHRRLAPNIRQERIAPPHPPDVVLPPTGRAQCFASTAASQDAVGPVWDSRLQGLSSEGGAMIDHVTANVDDLDAAKAFYTEALAPLGYSPQMEFEGAAVGFGTGEGIPAFWITDREGRGATYVAFSAKDRATVDAFHSAALNAGGNDNGAPGLRPHLHENYYGAFVHDAYGNNIEAVCHLPG